MPSVIDTGTPVAISEPAAVGELTQELTEARRATADQLRASHSVQFDADLGYDPLQASDLDRILNRLSVPSPDAAKAALAQKGFVVSALQVPSFAYGYSQIYAGDLPVFVSADMVLEALYRSHDKILRLLELRTLNPNLRTLLTSMRASLIEKADTLPADVASDLNLYLGVASSLLDGGQVDDRESDDVRNFVAAAMEASGEQQRVIFGDPRRIDFSQFKPRGHYAGDPALESYFRAMIWLGRLDFRLIETQEDGTRVLRRRQVESVVALRKLLEPAALAAYLSIDSTISAFVGEHDYMTLQQVDELLAALDAPNGIGDVGDTELAEALIARQFGEQRIASQVMRRRVDGPATFPLSLSFALLGQRYTVDSHVLSSVVYDRVPRRVVPDPLDAAFAGLGNDQALSLLGSELDNQPGYPGELSAIRQLVDEHPATYWESSLYTAWLSALRTLSPAATPSAELPSVARSDAWGRRLLNTQLSSWAQLRHNNVLYVKQSYTSSAACEYPDAYVDPYPQFFHGVVHFAERAQALLDGLEMSSDLRSQLKTYFAGVADINLTLAEMAEAQRSGAPHSDEHMAFINRAVTTRINCDGTPLGHSGWYSELHFEPLQAVLMDPVITDVHTDIGGPLPVSRPATVLHVGTGLPRPVVVTVDSCTGPHAYAGIISSYQQVLAQGLTRMTDSEWKVRPKGDPVPWLEPVMGE